MWKQIYACVDCSEKDTEGSIADYYHIYHIKDTINNEHFTDLKHVYKYLDEIQNDYSADKPEKDQIEPEDMSDYIPPVHFAIWTPHKKKYPKDAIILKLIDTNGGVRVRVVNNLGANIPNGALFFIKRNIRVYEHVNPKFGIELIQNNRIVVK